MFRILLHSYTMLVLGSGGLPPETFFKPNFLKHRKMPLHKIGKIEMGMDLKVPFRKIT